MKVEKVFYEKGISLLEALLYIAILAIMVIVIVNLATTIIRARVQTEARIEVEQNLRFALDKMAQDIKSATGVTGTYPSNTLNLTIGGSTTTYALSTGILQKTVGATTTDITTNKVIVSAGNGNIFSRIDQPSPAKTTIQIKLRVNYNAPQNPYLKDIESAGQTTVSLRQ